MSMATGVKDVLVLNQGTGTAQVSSDDRGGFVESNAVQLKFGISPTLFWTA
jgi:hypothetical protein